MLLFDEEAGRVDSLTLTLRDGTYMVTRPGFSPLAYSDDVKTGLVEGVADVLEDLASTG